MTKPQFALALVAAALLSFGCSQPTETQLTSDSELTAEEARAIARAAYIYAVLQYG